MSLKRVITLLGTASLLGATEHNLTITLNEGDYYHNSFKAMGLFTIKTTPQMAFWLEDLNGNFLQTLYISKKSGTSSFTGAKKRSRPSSLPIWSHKKGVKNRYGHYMPTQQNQLSDAVTGATPQKGFKKTFAISHKLQYRLYVEINSSMDFNDTYKRKAVKESPYYNNKVGGQPSLLYETVITPNNYTTIPLLIAGHGEAAGKDGKVYKTLETITTAKKIISSITATLKGNSK